MTQGDLFQKEDSLVISRDQGEAEYVPNFFSKEKADKYFNVINSETPWNRIEIICKIFQKK